MPELHGFPFLAMGTACTLHLYATEYAGVEKTARSAISEVRRIERRYSRYRSGSVLAEINRVAQRAGSIALDEETGGLLDYAYACYTRSAGLFDISSGILRKAWDFSANNLPKQETIDELLPKVGLDKISWESPRLTFRVAGMELDFGGIAKEYAADRAAEACFSLGIRHGLIDLGGDIKVIGPHPDLAPWSIGIKHPRHPESLMATVEIQQGALASSGDYERCIEVDGKRYSHIINPLTGWPVRGLSSVSVAAEQCMVAGSISTMAMLKGMDGIEWLRGLGVPHVWMDEEGKQGGKCNEL
jgi:thiamine biosynthesis lipoprotein